LINNGDPLSPSFDIEDLVHSLIDVSVSIQHNYLQYPVFIYLDIAKNTPRFNLRTGRFIDAVETHLRRPIHYTIEKHSKQRDEDFCELLENILNEYYKKQPR
jgi:hypothetical protein